MKRYVQTFCALELRKPQFCTPNGVQWNLTETVNLDRLEGEL